ncbi:MAG: CvpA family protein [Planctomycetes bacterium]|nr:CvpA family protein [Planctomycetota bacterium]
MDRLAERAAALPLADLLTLAVLLAGAAWGIVRGLGRSFGSLLWTLLGLWLASVLAPILLGWMPNTDGVERPSTLVDTYGVLAALVLVLPLVARLLGGTGGGKKRAEDAGSHRAFGALTGFGSACLLVTLALPFAWRLDTLAARSAGARAPRAAAHVADALALLYPDAFREALHTLAADVDMDADTSDAPR